MTTFASDTGLPRRPSTGLLGGLIVAAFTVLAVAGPLLAPYRPTALAGEPLAAPSAAHLLGTTSVGQDVASQLVVGIRLSLLVAVLAGVGTLLLGATIGLLAGWLRGPVDGVAMRVADVVLVLPKLPLLILIGAFTGPSPTALSAIIAVTFWPMTARIVRAQVLSLRRRAHLRAAIGFGAGTVHVLRRHVVPELGLVLAAELVPAAARAVALQAGLALLGLGDPTHPSLGSMMRDALDFSSLFVTSAWTWWLLPPVAAVTLLVLGITFCGVGIERRVAPRLARHVTGARG